MTFLESVKICLSKYADFSGRATRSEYWWFFLFYLLGSVVTGFIDGLFGLGDGFGVFGTLWTLALLLPSLAVTVRRYHDSDFRGWWILVPIINFVLLFPKGMERENRFGPDPLRAEALA